MSMPPEQADRPTAADLARRSDFSSSASFPNSSPTQSLPRPIEIIGAAIGCGAGDPRCEYGPDKLREWGFSERLAALGCETSWREQIYPHYGANKTVPQTIVPEFCGRLAHAVAAARGRGALPLVLGGDHSCGIGTWSGMHQTLWQHGAMGLLWIDAHMDSHTPDTTPTGALHGMPLAALLGYGDPRLVGLCGVQAKLAARHVCLVGVRSFEPGEADLVERLGVRVFFADEVRQRGLPAVMAEALAIVQSGTAGFGVSIDLDAVDPVDAPGVGSPVSGGIGGEELAEALKVLAENPRLLGLEIVEYNPFLDAGGATRELALLLAASALLPAQPAAAALQHPLAA
jgi:arginase